VERDGINVENARWKWKYKILARKCKENKIVIKASE
jgi:hypothetical protein